MLIRSFFLDLAVRIVVLGHILAQKPLKTAPKGHNFQPNPPAEVLQDWRFVALAVGASTAVLWASFTRPSIRQYLSWRNARMS